MKTLLLLLFVCSLCNAATEDKCREESIAMETRYQFAAFREGTVYFKNGKSTSALLNYNYLHGQVMFIGPGKDTLLLTNKYRIDRMEIDGSIFRPQDDLGEMEVIETFGKISLLQKRQLVIKGNGHSASDQKFTSNPGASTPSSLLMSRNNGELQWSNNSSPSELRFKTVYYILDQNNIPHQASKSAIKKIFAKNAFLLSRYWKENPVNFNDCEQLRKLLQYCSTI